MSTSTTIAAIIIALFCCAKATAADWSGGDSLRQGAWSVVHIADWGQTRDIARNPQQHFENNPYLGEHPTVGRVDSYMGFWLLFHPAISYALPKLGELLPQPMQRTLGVNRWREVWQYVTIGVKVGVVHNNYLIGLRTDFN